MSRKLPVMVTLAAIAMIAASPRVACAGGSCLEEFPCNVPADDPDASFDAGSPKVDAATHDAAIQDAAVDVETDAPNSDGSIVDAAIDGADGVDGGDAADD